MKTADRKAMEAHNQSLRAGAAIFSSLVKGRPNGAQPGRQLAKAVREALGTLELKAMAGDREAIEEYLALTEEAVAALQQIVFQNWEATCALARLRASWPGIFHTHPEVRERQRRLMVKMELGEDHSMRKPSGRRPWSFRPVSNAVVVAKLHLMDAMRAANGQIRYPTESTKRCMALPALTPATANKWFDVMWDCIMEETCGHPERDKQLMQLGSHRENKYERRDGGLRHSRIERTARTRAANVKDGIKSTLRAAFFRMVKSSPISRAYK